MLAGRAPTAEESEYLIPLTALDEVLLELDLVNATTRDTELRNAVLNRLVANGQIELLEEGLVRLVGVP